MNCIGRFPFRRVAVLVADPPGFHGMQMADGPMGLPAGFAHCRRMFAGNLLALAPGFQSYRAAGFAGNGRSMLGARFVFDGFAVPMPAAAMM